MKLSGGIDLHSNNSVIHLIDEQGDRVLKQRITHGLTAVRMWLKPFLNRLVGRVVESTDNGYGRVEGLMAAGFKVPLATTAALQQDSGLKHGDDDSDANWLAQMLRRAILPEGYLYPKEGRRVRDLLRQRLQLVQQDTRHLLSVQGLYVRPLNNRLRSNKRTQWTQEPLAVDFCLAVRGNRIVRPCLTQQIRRIETALKQQLKLKEAFINLTRIEGIGWIRALTLRLETGAISRFDTVGHDASYGRCVKGARYRNGKKKSKTNTKNGNKYRAWAFIEAAHFALRYSDTVKRYYQRKLAKTNVIVAKKAVAHKLARACFYVLRDPIEFDVNKAFGYSKWGHRL